MKNYQVHEAYIHTAQSGKAATKKEDFKVRMG